MDKKKKVLLSASAVVVVVLGIVLLMLLQPWQLLPEQPMEDPRSRAASPMQTAAAEPRLL